MHDVHISTSTLRQFYKKHKVKYLRVSYQYYQALTRGPQQKYNFAVRLAQLRDRNEIVVYLDEASFHLWLKKTHTWTRADRPVRILLGQNRCNGVTVIGAISTSLNRPVFALEKSTNSEVFGKFLVELR